MRGHFGIALYNPKSAHNWGSLLRTANILGASYICTINKRFFKQSSDTLKTWRHVPIFHFKNFDEFYEHLPFDTSLIAVELHKDAEMIKNFNHPERACYLFGSEDNGLPEEIIQKADHLIKLYGERSLNVSVAGSIVLYDRINKA